MKQQLKNIRDFLVGSVGRATWRFRDGLLVLTYHRVLPRQHPDLDIVEPGMLVHDDTFEMHLQFLGRYFEFVDLGEWIEAGRTGRAGKPQCAITFDDGWRDNYEYAFPLLEKYRVPATIFVVSSMVGTDREFWPERLARTLRRREREGSLTPGSDWLSTLSRPVVAGRTNLETETISAIIAAAKQTPDAEIHEYLDELQEAAAVGNNTRPALFNWQQAREMLDTGLVALGSHTATHTRLIEGVPPETLQREILGSQQEIRDGAGVTPRLFCYPNGTISPEGETLVRAHFEGACTTTYGWCSSGEDSYLIPRIHMHEGRTSTRLSFASRLTTSAI